MYKDNSLIPTEAVRLAALGMLQEAPRRYADLAAEVLTWSRDERVAPALRAWVEALGGAPGVLEVRGAERMEAEDEAGDERPLGSQCADAFHLSDRSRGGAGRQTVVPQRLNRHGEPLGVVVVREHLKTQHQRLDRVEAEKSDGMRRAGDGPA